LGQFEARLRPRLRFGSYRTFSGRGTDHPSVGKKSIEQLDDNFSGDYLELFSPNNRVVFTEFLPGPAVLMAALWKIVPIHNFAPYIILQIILDAILISLLYAVLRNAGKSIFLAAATIMVFNLPVIKRTLMMGYDFWPQFAVLVTFIGIYYAVSKNSPRVFLLAGLLCGITAWFRSIISLLPFVLVVFIA
jgi:hypothetical protein